jgi:hypothetical protein
MCEKRSCVGLLNTKQQRTCGPFRYSSGPTHEGQCVQADDSRRWLTNSSDVLIFDVQSQARAPLTASCVSVILACITQTTQVHEAHCSWLAEQFADSGQTSNPRLFVTGTHDVSTVPPPMPVQWLMYYDTIDWRVLIAWPLNESLAMGHKLHLAPSVQVAANLASRVCVPRRLA